MEYTVKIQDVYNSILNETKKELIVVKGLYREVYKGALFFKLDAYSCLCMNIYDEIKIENPSGAMLCLAAYDLLKKHDMLNNGTLKTMLHWQYMNGVTEDYVTDGYKFDNDEMLYGYLKESEEE